MVVQHAQQRACGPAGVPASPFSGDPQPGQLPVPPQLSSYFLTALVIEPPAQAEQPGAVQALWGRSVGAVLGHAPHYRRGCPVFWVLSVVSAPTAPGAALHPALLRLHAVRGLSAVVVSGSGAGARQASGPLRPQAVLWGEHTLAPAELDPTDPRAGAAKGGAASPPSGAPGAAAGVGGAPCKQRLVSLSCWVATEHDFPLIHVFSSAVAYSPGRVDGPRQVSLRCYRAGPWQGSTWAARAGLESRSGSCPMPTAPGRHPALPLLGLRS